MKILHVIDDLNMGGANALLVSLVPSQRDKGNEVDVLQLVAAEDKTLINKLKQKGIRVNSLVSNGSVYSPLHLVRLIPILKKYDLVHVHLFPALYWSSFAKLIGRIKTPLVYTEHSTTNKRRNNPILSIVDKFVYSHGYEEVIACSDKAFETYKKNFPDVNCITIPNGVDTKINIEAIPYSKNELLGIDENSFVVTMIARFASMKRQDTVVEAISKLPENVHAIFVGGDGGCMENVKKMAYDLNVSGRVHFLGIRSDVPRILKTSDVVIMASNYEGLSLSSIEGMASGRPFVASNVNGLKEVVGGYGELFENGDPDDLARVLLRLRDNSDFYEKVSLKCLERSKEFDISRCSESYLEEYRKFVK